MQRDQSELSFHFLMALVQFDDDRIVGSNRRVTAEHAFRHLRALPRLHRFDTVAGTLGQGGNLVSQAPHLRCSASFARWSTVLR